MISKAILSGLTEGMVVQSTLGKGVLAENAEKGATLDFWSKETDLKFHMICCCLLTTSN